VVGVTGGVAVFFFLGIAAAVRAQHGPPAMGVETTAGKVGAVRQALSPAGIVHLKGEDWTAFASDGGTVPPGTAVRVVGTAGLKLFAEVIEPGQPAQPAKQGPAS